MKSDSNVLKVANSRARFYKKIKAQARWKNPSVPEYDPNWLVRFSVGGETWVETADKFPVANGLRAVKEWAKEVILTKIHLAERGEIEKWRKMREPVKAVMLDELLKVYNGHVQGQDERLRDGLRLAAIWTETLGLPASQIPVTDAVWCPANIENWMRMRQEHYRRGWTATRKPPVDAWDQLRRELAAGTLPGIDMSTPMACNTTIRNYLKAGRTVFAHGRRFVRGLELPELRDFMTYKHGLTLPSGHREISQEVVDAIWEELPNLRLRCERAWLLFQILAHSAARPVTIKRMTVEDVTWSADGWCTLSLPATKGGDAVDVTLPPEIASPLKQHATREGLLGGYLDRVHYKTLNPWLRRRGVEDEHAAYLLRHRRLQQERDHAGVAAAAGLGGHKDEKMVRSIYTRGQRVQAAAIDPRTGEVILRAGEKPVKVRVTRPMHRQG
jgi:integrase